MITLMTDFGTDSPYVAAMKAAIYERLPAATVIDLTHAIAPQNIGQGAFVWYDFTRTFPAGTAHLAVVDPGVGGRRRIIAARYRDQFRVCPDNGLLTFFTWDDEPDELVEITNPAYWRPVVSPTFHGRDIMAPVAAAIASGVSLSELGTPCGIDSGHYVPPERLSVSLPIFEEKQWQLEALFADHFGNLLLNATMAMLPKNSLSRFERNTSAAIRVESQSYSAMFAQTYAGLQEGTFVLLESSSGRLELASVKGNASRQLTLDEGGRVTVTLG